MTSQKSPKDLNKHCTLSPRCQYQIICLIDGRNGQFDSALYIDDIDRESHGTIPIGQYLQPKLTLAGPFWILLPGRMHHQVLDPMLVVDGGVGHEAVLGSEHDKRVTTRLDVLDVNVTTVQQFGRVKDVIQQ